MGKKEAKGRLLGRTSPAVVFNPNKAPPFNPVKVTASLRSVDDGAVPHYCRTCGIVSYIAPKEAARLLGSCDQAVPDFQLGVYVENSTCPHCTGECGSKAVVKTFVVA